MRSAARIGIAIALLTGSAVAGFVFAPEAAEPEPALIDGIPAELYAEMRGSVCGDFDLTAPKDPTAFEGYETPVRVSGSAAFTRRSRPIRAGGRYRPK